MIVVTGSILAKSDNFDELLALSLEHVKRSRTEPGCFAHSVYRDTENQLRLVFLEEWADRAALAVHFEVPASKEFARRIKELAAETPALHIYDAAPVPFP